MCLEGGTMKYRILVINPGAGSTRIAVFDNNSKICEDTIRHLPEELLQFKGILDQYEWRKEKIITTLDRHHIDLSSLHAVVGRGGPFKPLASGTYLVNDTLIRDIKNGNYQSEHPSLLGVLIAYEIANGLSIEPYFVDPVSVDEFWEYARFSGLKEIKRKALSHALNVRMVAKKAAQELKKPYERCNFIIIHLGTGITVAAHLQGKQVDSSNANEDGPFSPQRSGTLPTMPLIALCFSGNYTLDEIKKLLNRKGGLISYLNTDDIKTIEERIKNNDEEALMVYEAMIYQIAKETGAYAVVLKGKIDAIIITGGIAHSVQFVSRLKEWIAFLCSTIFVFPGEGEMEALARGVLRVMKKEEKVNIYK
jgi:butyrate kinase